MRITKVVREHMEEVLSAKRLEANKKERAEYEARRKDCTTELSRLLDSIQDEALGILCKYNMDEEIKCWGSMAEAVKSIFEFKPQYIKNEAEEVVYNASARNRKAFQDEEIKRIELEAALGANKDEFMAMLAAVTF